MRPHEPRPPTSRDLNNEIAHNFAPLEGWGGYFWEVIVWVCCPAALKILTLFQSNTRKVNLREYIEHYQLLT